MLAMTRKKKIRFFFSVRTTPLWRTRTRTKQIQANSKKYKMAIEFDLWLTWHFVLCSKTEWTKRTQKKNKPTLLWMAYGTLDTGTDWRRRRWQQQFCGNLTTDDALIAMRLFRENFNWTFNGFLNLFISELLTRKFSFFLFWIFNLLRHSLTPTLGFMDDSYRSKLDSTAVRFRIETQPNANVTMSNRLNTAANRNSVSVESEAASRELSKWSGIISYVGHTVRYSNSLRLSYSVVTNLDVLKRSVFAFVCVCVSMDGMQSSEYKCEK